ncbi:MAG: metallophosphoesterase [Planctomycetota bacterium]|nr:MAG: metallophosphoesterase [Planctomycetota bacterium]
MTLGNRRMKILVISDVHSNLGNLNAVLAFESDADLVYCAGDLVDVGFQPCEVIDRLRSLNIPAVRGNHDDHVIELWRRGVDADAVPENFLQLNAQLLDADRIAYLESLPERLCFSHDGVSYLMQHLYKGYELLRSDYDFDEVWGDAPVASGSRHRCIIFGHTHHQAVTWLASDRCWINPGSVGYNRPQDPFPGTRYLTICDGEVAFHRLEHPAWCSRSELRRRFEERYPKAAE